MNLDKATVGEPTLDASDALKTIIKQELNQILSAQRFRKDDNFLWVY